MLYLLYLCGLPTYLSPIVDGCEIINVVDEKKPLKKNYNPSRKCQTNYWATSFPWAEML
jgi:hypothetical protein